MPLDPRGLNCPLPVLRTRKMLSRLAYGDRLSVKCNDPLAVIDIPHRLRETGDTLERREAARGLFFYSVSSMESMEQFFRPWPADAAGSRRRYSGFIMEKPFHPASHLRFFFGVRCRRRCDNLR